MGLWRRSGLFGGFRRGDYAKIEEAIAAVGLTGFEGRAIGTLSGGQMQRTLFARLLLQDARVIVLDEPFTAVDAKTEADLFELLRRWHSEQRTILAALHDLDLVEAGVPDALLPPPDPLAAGPAAAGPAPRGAGQGGGVRRGGDRRRGMTTLAPPAGRGYAEYRCFTPG